MGPHADDRLAEVLETLASPPRLAILSQLRTPKILAELRIFAENASPGAPPRPIARQAVREHLRKLLEHGLVVARPAERDFGDTLEYVVNHQRLFLASEELRRLARLRPEEEVAEPTEDDQPLMAGASAYPRLLKVRGLDEGEAFPLPLPVGGQIAHWTIGRKRGLPVCLDYDPFVSLENSVLTWDGTDFAVETLPQSRNGTTVNFRMIPPGRAVQIQHGDVLGVGRSLLVLQLEASPVPLLQ